MRTPAVLKLFTVVGLAAGSTTAVLAQETAQTRSAVIVQEQAEKAKILRPHQLNKGERLMNKAEDILVNGGLHWHPFMENSYSGGGFALGAGYMHHVSSYNLVDVRGSYSIRGYKRAEAEFIAPRMFNRRATLSVLGGWRDATQVGFYGIGMDTSVDDRTNYAFEEPYGSALFTIWPARKLLVLSAGVEVSRWSLKPGQGLSPSTDTVYSSTTLPGVDSQTKYLHSQGSVGLDWRTSPGYSRRGGYYGVTLHDYKDNDEVFGFQQADYEVIQHFPILREAWVISLRGRAQTAFAKDGQKIPFFMLPSLGGGSTLRGYTSWRFRDNNSLLFQAEWRIMANRFLESAVFYDTGKVTSSTSDFDSKGLKSDFGFGVRFHGPFATPLRIDLAKSTEGLALVFSSSAPF